MANQYRHPVFLTQEDYEFLCQMAFRSCLGGQAKAEQRARINTELQDAAGDAVECDENGNAPY